MARISQFDRDDFAQFCRQASDRQLPNIIERERKANRRVYRKIAEAEQARRERERQAV